MSFKVGDKIKGLKNGATFTNENMLVGVVEDVWTHLATKEEYIDIRIISHKDASINGDLYPAANKSEYFQLIK